MISCCLEEQKSIIYGKEMSKKKQPRMFYSKRILKKKLACKTESVLKDKDNLDIAN